ncbi:VanZ family protein [Desulfobacterium sp. N47]|uniref:VanZ-like domain-containing protein n=1 Tax=uncultured Desulfobacterium sp. TaxID=201089 RepID=E1YKZ1_9BACT|nr:hypothetical protein N47_E42860 [uncultured Desulfobacterium sp.]
MKPILKYIPQLKDIDPGLLRVICLAVILAIILAGFWPFNILPENKVKWLINKNGISFYGQAIVFSSGLLKEKNESLFPDGSISMELRLKPKNKPGDISHIVDFYDGKLPGVVTVGQWRSHLILLSRTGDPAQFKRGAPYKQRGLSNALVDNQDVFLTITSDKKGSAVYINGMQAKAYPGFSLLSEYKDQPFLIVVGNSPTGQGFWEGELMGLAMYNQVLTPEQIAENYQLWMQENIALLKGNSGLLCLYPFDEKKGSIIRNHADSGYSLIIPEIFRPVQRIFLEPPWREKKWNLSYLRDVIINLTGFIPFGFFIVAFLVKKRRFGLNTACFIVIISGFVFSLSIELTQAYLPARCSQLSDLILNTFSTAIGVILVHKFVSS